MKLHNKEMKLLKFGESGAAPFKLKNAFRRQEMQIWKHNCYIRALL